MRFVTLIAVGVLAASVSGCANYYYDLIGRGEWPHEDNSLYSRLGGQQGVAAMVDGWVDAASADPRIKGQFAKVDLTRFKAVLAQWVCVNASGPCVYTGPGLIDAHTGLAISEADFNAFIDDLKKNLEAKQVSTDDQEQLLSLLQTRRGSVVQVKG